LYTDYGL